MVNCEALSLDIFLKYHPTYLDNGIFIHCIHVTYVTYLRKIPEPRYLVTDFKSSDT